MTSTAEKSGQRNVLVCTRMILVLFLYIKMTNEIKETSKTKRNDITSVLDQDTTRKISEFLSVGELAKTSTVTRNFNSDLRQVLEEKRKNNCNPQSSTDPCQTCVRGLMERMESGPGFDEFCIGVCPKQNHLCGRLAILGFPSTTGNYNHKPGGELINSSTKYYCRYHFDLAAIEAQQAWDVDLLRMYNKAMNETRTSAV